MRILFLKIKRKNRRFNTSKLSIIFWDLKRESIDNFIPTISTFKGKYSELFVQKKKKKFQASSSQLHPWNRKVTTGKQLIKQSATSTSIRRLRFDIAPPIITSDHRQRASPGVVNGVMICDRELTGRYF